MYFMPENCQKTRIDGYIRQARNSLKKAIVEAELVMNGFSIKLCESKTRFGGLRLWFECPECKRRVGIIYKNPINKDLSCRQCTGLIYQQQKNSRTYQFHKSLSVRANIVKVKYDLLPGVQEVSIYYTTRNAI
jgi:hypothetical protein